MKFRFILFISLTLLLSHCKNDFKVNEDWKDYTIVYGILNQYDSVNYVRVTKSFLGNQDAYAMAQISDSLYYKNINVKIEEWLNSSLNKTIDLVKDSFPRENGIFAIKNYVFKTNEVLNPLARYKLIVNVNGKEVTSETSLLEDFTIELPGQIALHSEYTTLKITCVSKPDQRIFEPTLRFWYYEITSQGDTTKKYLDLTLAAQISPTINGGEKIISELKGDQFLSFVGNNLQNDPNVIKRVVAHGSFDILVDVGSDDMYTYMQVNAPATGIVSEKPIFSNITNGLGLFTSRIKGSKTGKIMAYTTLDSLAKGQFTKNLKFLTQLETVPYWSNYP